VSYYEELAARLDRYEHVPDDVLLDIVTGEGTCMWLYANDLEPDWLNDSQ
jgi:WhiB family transcriptional regulator, redox-sensing transcriptional regulator